jgi:hypothetical protein
MRCFISLPCGRKFPVQVRRFSCFPLREIPAKALFQIEKSARGRDRAEKIPAFGRKWDQINGDD